MLSSEYHSVAWNVILVCTSALNTCGHQDRNLESYVSGCMGIASHLAVAGVLDFAMLSDLVQTMCRNAGSLEAFASRSARVSEARVSKDRVSVNRALEYVEPQKTDSQQYEEWLELRQLIPHLPVPPGIARQKSRVSKDMLALLKDNNLLCSDGSRFGSFRNYTCPKCSAQATPVIINFHGAQDYFKNQPNR